MGIAGQDFVADGGQAFAEHLAHVRVLPRPADDLLDAVLVNVADGELIQIRSEAATGLHLAARIDDQSLAGAFTIVLDKPGVGSRETGVRSQSRSRLLTPDS